MIFSSFSAEFKHFLLRKGNEFMAMNLVGRNFLTLKDFTPEEIRYLLNLSADFRKAFYPHQMCICCGRS
jgi:hypothetical protein